MTNTIDLRAALAGRLDAWRWQPGLDPDAIGAALGVTVEPGPAMYAGHPRLAASLAVDGLPWPVWAAWREDGELLLLDVTQPPEAPTGPAAVEAYGPPELRIERGRGPQPSAEQLAWLTRGFTLFAWADEMPRALWLYRPMTADDYEDELGALISPTRPRR